MTEGRLAGRVAVVTGAGKGFGEAIARRLAAEGADLVLSYRSSEGGCRRIAEERIAAGGRAITVQADVTVPADVDRLVGETVSAFGGTDILVNNAGVLELGPFAESTRESWEAQIATNVVGTLAVTRALLPHLRGGGTGRVIVLSSQLAPVGWEIGAVYAGTKAFVLSWAKSLARELGPRGITVNAIGPGSIRTDMNADLYGDEESQARRRAALPLRRHGSPDDIGAVAAFLASDDAAFMTGQFLVSNGGAVI